MFHPVTICPICLGSQFVDRHGRPKARCSSCGSLERTRLAWLILEKILPPDKLLEVLHFAPEEGLARKLNTRFGSHYHAFDINPNLYAFDFLKVNELDLCNPDFRFEGQSVDLILHNHVMEHLPCNYACVMMALNALLRPEGFHVFSVPITTGYYREDLDPILDEKHRRSRFAQGDHMRSFGHYDLTAQWHQIFQQDVHFSKRVSIRAESLVTAAIPLAVLTENTSHTVFVWQKPEARFRTDEAHEN